ncbi:hypothetical protein GCM10023116_36610 [Kistimonas scapharcae]|uniref:DUF11 domain-containing protein n=1 Tax=Kistimonas scapharcae TaxID=1036133 RepID=A0ABP8V8T5_9GAMM
MLFKPYRMTLLLMMAMLCLVTARAACALAPAGTVILNQAEAAYFDTELGQPVKVLSNPSTVRVAAVHVPVLSQDQQVQTAPGTTVSFIHHVFNRGNIEDSYRLDVTACVTGSASCDVGGRITILGVFSYDDRLPTPEESPIHTTDMMKPGESRALIVMARVSATVAANDSFTLSVSARSEADDHKVSTNHDRITAGRQSVLIRKNSLQSITDPRYSDIGDIHYDLSLTNNGDIALPERTLVVDGQEQQGILLEDRIPANTRLSRVDDDYAPRQAHPVVRLPNGRWVRYDSPDYDPTDITRVGLLLPASAFQPGMSARLGFNVIINQLTVTTVIRNRAGIDTEGDGRYDFESNETADKIRPGYHVNGGDPRVMFMEPRDRHVDPTFDSSFQASTHYFLPDHIEGGAHVHEDVFVTFKAPHLNTTTEEDEIVEVLVVSGKTGDRVRVLLRETGVNTGEFRSVSPLRLSTSESGSNQLCTTPSQQPDYSQPAPVCRLKSMAGDRIKVSYHDSEHYKTYSREANVSTIGLVFDSGTLAPVKGAKVAFYDIDDQPAVDPVSGSLLPASVTDDKGHYLYPRLQEGMYYIQVDPPSNSGYQFPSSTEPESYSGLHVVKASYGKAGHPRTIEETGRVQAYSARMLPVPEGAFPFTSNEPLQGFDVPLDAGGSVGNQSLTLDKAALQNTVAPGEMVGYKLIVTNNAKQSLYNLRIHDRLPYGFKYARGSVRINGQPAAEPEGVPGPELTFVLNQSQLRELAPQQQWEITYVLKAGAGAVDGDGINTAWGEGRDMSGLSVRSNDARAQVTVQMDGVLSDKAILFGKLYVDGNGNGIQDEGEWPLGGVRLYMEDGTWVITDENGQYSLMGLKPGTHVLKVDPVTLPDGLVLKPLDNRNGADGNSRFVDLSPGDFHRADFAAQCPEKDAKAIFAQIKARNASINGDWLLDEAAQYSRSSHNAEQADNIGDLSNGVVRGPKKTDSDTASSPSAQSVSTAGKTPDTVEPLAKMPPAKEAVSSITRQQAVDGTWLWPEGTQADGRFMVVVRAGVTPTLYVNDQPVGADRLGEQLMNNREQAQLLAWYGVPMKEGENHLEVRATDFFGNERVLAKGVFNNAGLAERLVLEPARDTLPADEGRSLLPVKVRLLDRNGLPARGVYFVTLDSSAGQWQEKDVQDQEPGHQIRIEQGEALVHLRSGATAGPVKLRASTNDLKADAEVTQIAAPRPLVAVGLVDISASKGKVNSKGRTPSEIDGITDGFDTSKRTAFFVKGEVAKETQLTLSYDSDKDKDQELFRDVDPDDYYPITGDASQKGYEAQSRSKLYAKLEKGRSSIMWGDYQTDSNAPEQDLARIQRTLTGINAIYDDGITRLQGFGARPEDMHRSEIIMPDGTAMNYRLQGAPIVRNSDVVVLEVWSRDNPGLMLSTETLSRGRDYTLDEFSGYLKFSEPMHRQDEKGNPQRIRVSYDVEGDGTAYTVAGVRAEQKLNDQVRVGVSHTRDEHKTEGKNISGAWVEYKPTEKTTVTVSGATLDKTGKPETTSTTDQTTTPDHGNAYRVKINQQWTSNGETELTWARADAGYDNSAGGVSSGREESRLEHKQRLNDSLDLRAEAETSRSLDNSTNSSGSGEGSSVGLSFDKRLPDAWTLTGGSRYISQKGDEDAQYATGLVGVGKQYQLLGKNASTNIEYEHALTNARWRTVMESDWQVHEKVSLYGRYERDENLSPVSNGEDRNSFALGVKSDWLPNTRTYSEYRMRGATDGGNLEWVNGADTRLEIEKGLSLTPSVEWIQTVHEKNKDNRNDGLALSLGIQDKRRKNQRATGRVEYRHGEQQNYYGLDAAVARRLDLDWSGLVREEFRLELPRDSGSRTLKHAMTLGLARRPRLDNRQHGLYLYQWKEERGENPADDRTVHLISTHQNRQIARDLVWSGRIGSKWVKTSLDDYQYSTQTWVADSRLTWDIDRRWDMDLRAGVLAVDGMTSRRWSAGIGVHYLVVRNLRVGAYYNVVGFTDDDLDSEKYNAKGLHLSLQFKFDESLFDWFAS